MTRPYAIAMTRPRQHFGFKEPIGRQIPHGAMGWGLVMLGVWLVCAAVYVTQVTTAAPRSDKLETYQRKIDQLERDVMAAEDGISQASSMHALTERAQALGFVPASQLQFINPASHAFVRR